MKALFILFFLLPVKSFSASNFLEFGDVNFGRDFKEKSKWVFKSGGEYIKYASSLPDFKGVHESIQSGEVSELNGYGLNLGRDFYISSGFSWAFHLGGYYSKTLDTTIGKAASNIDFDVSKTRTAHQFIAYELSSAINYTFDYKIIDIQPFIEFGVGSGEVEVEKEYTRIGLTSETNGSEDYDIEINESFQFSRISLGINLISYKGLMSYVKLTSMQMLTTDRTTSGVTKSSGSTVINIIDLDEKNITETQTVTMISLGIGRYF